MVSWPFLTSLSGKVWKEYKPDVREARDKKTYLQMRCETKPTTDGNEPFCGVVLVPPKGISKVRRELMVEIMVTFAECNYGSHGMITRCMLVVKRGLSKPVCQGIDTECRVVDEDQSGGTSIYISPAPITPEQTRDNSGNTKTHEEDERDIPTVLPPDHFVLAKVRDVCYPGFTPWLHDHPANVGPQETAMGIVGIKIGIRITVVRAVSTRPPLDRPLHSTSAHSSKEVLQRLGCVV